MSLPATIQTAVGQSILGKITRLYNNSVADVLNEILQNCRRAGATRVDIDSFELADRQVLVIRDDGSGIDDPAKLVTLGDSGWDSTITHREDPAGMGVFSLAGHRVEIRSFSPAAGKGWCVTIAPDAWESGTPLEIEPCSIARGTEILIDMPAAWASALSAAAATAATFYPLPVHFQGERCAQRDFLAEAHRVEQWSGCRIGIFRGRNYRSPTEVSINFHGLTVPCPMPSVSEVGGDGCWYVRVDIVDAPALQLVLPARKEMVQNAALDELREAAEAAIYRTIAVIGSHRLAYEQWQRAQALGVTLPEAAPWLSGWVPRTADADGTLLGDPVAGTAMILVPCEESPIEQCAGRILCEGLPLGGTLVREVAGFEGYGWYDALPRVSDISFSVESDAGVYSYRGGDSLPTGIESGRVARITLDVAVKPSACATGDDGRHSFPADILIAPDDGWYSNLDQTVILLTQDSTITPHELASLIEDACFTPGDDCEGDSWDTQHSYFEKRARQVANELLLGEETAILERIRDVLLDEVNWPIPEGRRVTILAERGQMTLSYVPDEDAVMPAELGRSTLFPHPIANGRNRAMRRTSLHIYSTVHLPEAERAAIDRLILAAPRDVGGRLAVEHLDLVIEPYQFGFFVHTGVCEDEAERPDSISPEFWAILRAAALAGAAWILFDRDEPPTQGLPMFGARPTPGPCHSPRQREYHHD